jgi:hypothetical protein
MIEIKQHEQTRQQLTTPKARLGHDYILSDEVCAESACLVG